MTKKSKQAIARMIFLAISIFIIILTLQTICIGLELALISQENANAETWRISGSGKVAANNVYESNMIRREAIYNSSNAYTRWISTSNTAIQLTVGFSLVALSAFCSYIWYTYITMKVRRFRKRLAKKLAPQKSNTNKKNNLIY